MFDSGLPICQYVHIVALEAKLLAFAHLVYSSRLDAATPNRQPVERTSAGFTMSRLLLGHIHTAIALPELLTNIVHGLFNLDLRYPTLGPQLLHTMLAKVIAQTQSCALCITDNYNWHPNLILL